MSRENRIPVIIVGGFLGAGKTTLVNSLIGQADGRRIAALVNDFGALNIDAGLVVGVDGNTIALANGCICCTIRDDLARACADLVRQSQRPDVVIVELSGVSEPGPVLSTFLETELVQFFELSGVVTVVDALTWGQHGDGPADLLGSQLRSADVIALSKTDIADAMLTSNILRDLKKAAPGTPVFPAPRGTFPLAMLLHEFQSGKRTVPIRVTDADHGLSTWTWRERRLLSLPKLEDT
ncbi:MAG: GTP-binding protein, partial [Pseudomonadota bacterium]